MKYILLAFVLIGFALPSKSTHLMGGEIIARQVSGTDYQVTLRYYRDVFGIQMDTTQFVHIYDDQGNGIDMDPSTPTVIDGIQLQMDSVLSAQLLPGYPYQVEAYVFRSTITFPSVGEYKIVKAHCCRNGALINILGATSKNMYISTNVTIFANQNNSTPDFLAPPVIHLPIFTPWQYNPVPFDSDGDSLVWSLYVPLSSGPNDLPAPTAGPVSNYTDLTNYSVLSGLFSLDSNSGVISWTADSQGNFQAAVLVEEYRNGVKIGEIMRDMQFIVNWANPPLPRVANIDSIAPVNQNGYRTMTLQAGQPFQTNLIVNVPGPSNQIAPLFLFAYGGPMVAPTNPAMLSAMLSAIDTTGNNNEIQGVFSWTPDNNAAALSPFILNLRTSDGYYNYDETILVTVIGDPTGVEVNDIGNTVNVYPNPNNGVFTVELDNEQLQTNIKVMNSVGQIVHQLNSNYRKQIAVDLTTLPQGMYFLILENETGRASKKVLTQY